jgi:hypothetical protein
MNRYSIVLYILFNSGANSFAFIDIRCVNNLAKFFNLIPTPLPEPIPVKDYDSKSRAIIIYIIRTYFIVNEYR